LLRCVWYQLRILGATTGIATFRALGHRDFRLLWSGFALSSAGTWMQVVAQSLLVLDLTGGSAMALGTVSLCQASAYFVFAPLGGGAADRHDRRRLLLLTQSLMMALAALLGVLVATGAIRFWMIPLAAFVNSSLLSFDQPARNALVTSVVPKDSLMNAISLQSAVFNGASILGPALAGLALNAFGYAGNFFLNSASYTAMIGALLLVRPPRTAAEPGRGLIDSVREALRFVRQDAVLPPVVAMYGALLFFGPSMTLVLPVFAEQILRVGPVQLGMLFSAVGAGTVVSALTVASLGDFRRKGALLTGSILLWTLALAAFGWSGHWAASLAALFTLGAAQSAAGATSMTLLQTRVPPEMRGRTMSLNTILVMGVRPLGDFPAGAAIQWIGARTTVLLSAAVVAAVLLASVVTRPAVRRS
jgi:MFS family permease